MEFAWKISSQNHRTVDSKVKNSWQEVLRFLRFAESRHHEVPKEVEYLESIGLRGSMTLLEGVNTGSASVTVTLPYPEYNKIPPLVVQIMVLANLMLDPSDAHILVGDTIEFKIKQLKRGKLEEVSAHQYYLEIANDNYATLDGNFATGHTIGNTTVYLRDRNVPNNLDNDNAPMPTATLSITDAKQLTLNLLPQYNWVTVVGERHEIAVDLMSRYDITFYIFLFGLCSIITSTLTFYISFKFCRTNRFLEYFLRFFLDSRTILQFIVCLKTEP